MANKQISELLEAVSINDADLFVLQQSSTAKKLKGSTLKQYIDRNLLSITVTTLAPGSSATATFNPSTGALALGIPKGDKGDAGDPASESVAGVMKLYTSTGSNTDGTMTQAAIVNLVQSSIASAIQGSY